MLSCSVFRPSAVYRSIAKKEPRPPDRPGRSHTPMSALGNLLTTLIILTRRSHQMDAGITWEEAAPSTVSLDPLTRELGVTTTQDSDSSRVGPSYDGITDNGIRVGPVRIKPTSKGQVTGGNTTEPGIRDLIESVLA